MPRSPLPMLARRFAGALAVGCALLAGCAPTERVIVIVMPAPLPPAQPLAVAAERTGLVADVYEIPAGTQRLPDFGTLVSRGSFDATSINVPGRHHSQGFPGVGDRTLWFGVDYHGGFTVAREGYYRFRLTADDGARLEIDGEPIIDNDGIHPPVPVEGRVFLARGPHRIHVPYFQGPADLLALVLEVAPDGKPLRVFRTDRPLD